MSQVIGSQVSVVRAIIAVSDEQPWGDGERNAFGDWAAAQVDRQPVLLGAEVDLARPDLQARHTGSDSPPRYQGIFSVWTTGDFPILSLHPPRGESEVFIVDDVVRIDYPRTWLDGVPTPGIKKTTFWRSPAHCADWRARYHRHADVARRCHRSAWRYRQNLVRSTMAGDQVFDAVSELWWPDESGLIDHFYADEQARLEVAEDVVFVDQQQAWPVVTEHLVLRTPPRER